MWMFVIISLGAIHTLQSRDINSMDQYDSDGSKKHDLNKYEETDKSIEEALDKSSQETADNSNEKITTLPTTEPSVASKPNVNRRYWLVSSKIDLEENDQSSEKDNNDKDANLKNKITTLVEQTLHDTERKLRSLHRQKDKHKDEAPYKVGFILSLIKKSKEVLNELFNVAVKHRNDYKALEELKIFEVIVHTNVDTTHLVRQMVEIHIQYMNSSNSLQHRNRVVLLKTYNDKHTPRLDQ